MIPQSFKHNDKKYAIKEYNRHGSRYIVIMDDDVEMGRIMTKEGAHAIWVSRAGEDQKCIRTPRKGMQKPEIMSHHMKWIVDTAYVVPELSKPPKVRRDGWAISVLSEEEKKQIH